MTVVALIQARISSTRLPGKVLKNLSGKPVLQWVVDAARAIPGVDEVVVATSDDKADDAIEVYCKKNKISIFRGSQSDVLSRMAGAARKFKATHLLRLTADCPLLDPHVCGTILAMLKREGCDYASNIGVNSWPDGLDCEAMTASALFNADKNAKKPSEREHVTPYIRKRGSEFKSKNFFSPMVGLENERWTLDDKADYEFLLAVTRHFLNLSRPPFYTEVLDVLAEHPEIYEQRSKALRNEGMAKSIQAEIYQSNGYKKSQDMLKRAERFIPLGSQTFSKSRIQFPVPYAPMFIERGQGGRVWDADGNEYVDLICGLLPVSLGYQDLDVNRAVIDQLAKGISFSLAVELETELAERLVDLIPCAEMVRFGKNGTDATSAAIRLARAFTGREHVVVLGYHGWQDWYIGATTRHLGVPEAVRALTHKLPYNDIEALKKCFSDQKEKIAAIIMEPVSADAPKDGYLQAVRELTKENGALLIFDEVITGFRAHIGGAQALYGVTPDLAAFGKSMGNGMPISAVVGRADIMNLMSDIFYSGTFGGEALSLAAAIAVIDKMKREPVIETLARNGAKFAAAAEKQIRAHDLEDIVRLAGLDHWKILTFKDHPKASGAAIKTRFMIDMLRNGVLIAGSHNACYAHNDTDVAVVEAAYKIAMSHIQQALDAGNLEQNLEVPPIQPIFQVRS
jgi:glutamate-1-semialdehyde 2,1-aminomutase/spore coat polysaccharide biosynthesis protein SpsF